MAPSAPSSAERLRERLLAVMDRKDHWAYPTLTRPGLSRGQLLEHFRHEYAVYVRDFPALLARALGQTPPLLDVRVDLAENLYEEQTGGLSRTGPHPELFMGMMEAMGYSRSDFGDDRPLHPAASIYGEWLRRVSAEPPWQVAVAVLTLFVEGSVHERAELNGTRRRGTPDEVVARHPLVLHYGCPPSAMVLARAHAAVEGSHRTSAWRILLTHLSEYGADTEAVVAAMEHALQLWHAYRDGVAEQMGLHRTRHA